jgi:3-methyladenine DNA glycosylase AlkD
VEKPASSATLSDLERDLARAADPERARQAQSFFKTGKGQYGEGDQFLGIPVPVLRQIAKRYRHLRFRDLEKLLRSSLHEHRFTALEILVFQYEGGDTRRKQKVFDFYLKHTRFINNWDLVDTSTPYIVGEHLLARPRKVLYRLAKSKDIWERRIAILATLAFIKRSDLDDTFAIAALLLNDKHDLIHKAVGWMLRETGKREEAQLLEFLEQNYLRLPRTTLRYAIERFKEPLKTELRTGSFSRRLKTRALGRSGAKPQ